MSDREIDPEELEEPKLFELKLTEMNVSSGSMPITWCLDKKWLQENKLKDYWVLFLVSPPTPNGANAEWRGYAKLSDMMAYITFHRPGKNRIYARLSNSKSTVKGWMTRDQGRWDRSYIDYPTHDWEIELYNNGEWNGFKLDSPKDRPSDYMDIDMPEDCFASEPWEFETTWVNWLWREKAIDQCEFRKRRMFAYSIQPFLFFFNFLARLIVSFAFLMVAVKGANWSALWNPLTTSISDFWADVDGTYLYVRKWRDSPASVMFVPMPSIALIAGIVGFFAVGTGGFWYALVVPAFILAVVAAMAFTAWLITYTGWLGDRLTDYLTIVERRREARWAEWEARQRELMSCSNDTRITKIKDLPKKKRTVRLRFQGLKSMVCKPFSR